MLALCAACASTPETDARYAPTESVLEVVSVLRLHTEDNTYRFPPARDFAGKNIYRASLARLESLEQIHEEKLRSGYLLDSILFAKGRALERITEYDLAAKHYGRVASFDSPLAESARRSSEICSRLHEAATLVPAAGVSASDAEDVFERRRLALVELRGTLGGSHYAFVIDEELERTAIERAVFFARHSALNRALEPAAIDAFQALIRDHETSKNHDRHLLRLADYFARRSQSYVLEFPPASLDFDPAAFDEYAFGARRLYEVVSRRDGAIEKIEAARKLEAFLSFTLSVYDEKLTR